MIKYKEQLFQVPPARILYCHGSWQKAFDAYKGDDITFYDGLPDEETINEFSADGTHKLVVLDDLLSSVRDNTFCEHLFTKMSHHKNLSICFISQNLFTQGKCARTISLNSHYIILLRSPRDVRQISTLASQTGLGSVLKEAYRDVMSKPYAYLLVDLCPHNKYDTFRLKTSILPDEDTVVYLKA